MGLKGFQGGLRWHCLLIYLVPHWLGLGVAMAINTGFYLELYPLKDGTKLFLQNLDPSGVVIPNFLSIALFRFIYRLF